ncbi:serine/threonine-protein kinase PCRK1-like isoform X1 [Vicia villosa]|uniref:serine/threonine-protein kinase PCRK1-like isoform X1 n=1 Tax=Vicia villosa TaxID=3911 RepID=UPI00273C210A|nr:serine/threonine-protein kinase PCRK1-like isoform X1 [Vicia villosa]XP_058771148.1 serine/threonine-protein kinase PCRK1-like isoform X1 [Vicia villosa]XP_058771149.1 serine/threonine-protein kinase PCRK1-like isoform X1 [Vicia villosa]
MNCFPFNIYYGEKKGDDKGMQTLSGLSNNSTYGGSDMRRTGSELNSLDASSGNSSDSLRRNAFPNLSQRPSNLRVFTVSELKSATKNFGRSVMLGEGGFGCVYKGLIKSLDDPPTKIEVAVKQLGKRGIQGHKEWVTEVNVLGIVEHPNLVKLVGYCADDDERGIQRLLIYQYMPNGSVEHHLSPRSETPLPWSRRLKIAQDAARGLTYLHEEMDFQIIFRDFKSSNILLDEQWNAKLSDFGLARLGPSDGLTHVSTAVVGTMGYAAPEYIQTGRLTSKIDVWSYGVFLYELITGRRPLDRNRPKGEQKLLDWIRPYLSDVKKFQIILDPRLERKHFSKSAQKLALVANRCLVRNPKNRPKMSEVLEMVNQIVESSASTIPQPSMNSVASADDSQNTEIKNKKRIMDPKPDCNWFRSWRPKLLRTC